MSVFALAAGLTVLWLFKQILGILVAQQARGSVSDYTARRARAAARLLPAEIAVEFEQDWLAELRTLEDKPLSAIRYAHGLPRAARSIAIRLGGQAAGSRWWAVLSRALDVNSAVVTLVVLAPLFGLFVLVLKLVRRGPVLDRRLRVGRGGQCFELICFRTDFSRHPGTGELSRFLYRSGLATLPNMVNVLRGDISMIGPPAQRPGSEPLVPPAVRPGMSSWQGLVEVRAVGMSLQEARRRDRQRTFGNDMALMGHILVLGLRQLFWPN